MPCSQVHVTWTGSAGYSKKTHTPAMRRLILTIGKVLIYFVNLAVSLGCDLLDNVTMVKHNLVF